MNKFFIFISLCINTIAYGQKPIPEPHKDHYDSFEKIAPGKIRNEISCFNISGGQFEKRDSLLKIYFDEIPVAAFTDSSILFKKEALSVKLSSVRFDTTNLDLGYINGEGKNRILIYIQQKSFWGTDGGFPQEKINNIEFRDGKTKVLLPDSAFSDLFEPNFCHIVANGERNCLTSVYRSKDKHFIYIYMLNSDGAGGYEVTFVLQDRKYLRRVVDYGF